LGNLSNLNVDVNKNYAMVEVALPV